MAVVWLAVSGLGSAALLAAGLTRTQVPPGVVMTIAGAMGLAITFVAMMIKQAEAAILGLAAVGSGAVLAVGLLPDSASDILVGAGMLGLVVTAGFAVLLASGGGGRADGDANIVTLLHRIHEQSMLSDSARRVLYRERELELLRRTIEDDLSRGDFNAALVLCDDMERLFGYTVEAEQARERVLNQRNAVLSEEIQQQVLAVHQLVHEQRWKRAEVAARRLHRLYPDSPQLEELERGVQAALQEHKRALHDQLQTARAAGEVQQAMDLLRQLDEYLQPQEAEAIRDEAQEVIARHREWLSGLFREAVSSHDWAGAINCGERIIECYPMDTMATEVREMMDRLQARARGSAKSGQGVAGSE